MAVANVIILSSSPTRITLPRSATPPLSRLGACTSSSPGLPPPSMLIRQKSPGCMNGSRATVVPNGAIAGFTTAANFLGKEGRGVRQESGKKDEALRGDVNLDTAGFVRPLASDLVREDTEGYAKAAKVEAPGTIGIKGATTKKGRPRTDANIEQVGAKGAPIKERKEMAEAKVVKKPRAKVEKPEAQAKITKKAKVTKPGLEHATKRKSRKNYENVMEVDDGIVSKHFESKQFEAAISRDLVIGRDLADDIAKKESGEVERYETQKAITRRPELIPLKESVATVQPLKTSSTPAKDSATIDQTTTDQDANGFIRPFSDFEYDKDCGNRDALPPKRAASGEAMRKKRRTDLQDPGNDSPVKKLGTKTKAPKKKPKTITEQATAQYVASEPLDPDPLLRFLSYENASIKKDSILDDQSHNPAKVEKPANDTRKKRIAKPNVARKPKGKLAPPVTILLSPGKALKKFEDQDLLFGTSSQLASEDSPTLIRDLEQAMKASVTGLESFTGESTADSDRSMESLALKGSNTSLFASSRGLWSAAARDSVGSMMKQETPQTKEVVLIDRISQSRILGIDSGAESIINPCLILEPPENERAWVMGDGGTEERALFQEAQSSEVVEQDQDATRTAITVEIALSKVSRARSPKKRISRSKDKASVSMKHPQAAADDVVSQAQPPGLLQKPDITGYPTTRLAKELASFGFKPIKSRSQMIILLEKCWEGKNRVALQTLQINVNGVPSQPNMDTSNAVTREQNQIQATEVIMKRPSIVDLSGEAATTGGPSRESTKAIEPVKKRRGRPPKTITLGDEGGPQKKKPASKGKAPTTGLLTKPKGRVTCSIDEIEDSEPETTPSPHRRRPPPSTPNTLQLTPPAANQSLDVAPTDEQNHLFAAITKAIKTCPPSTDLTNPSWHEKILMYDPIVLEDLAMWLNTQGLARTGVDEEVGPAVVKVWCEERSVCCLWKENLRGGTRSRY
ncbi:MAG: 5'-flap endonuclease [Pycnora praestabilis]|nr:MAG: 5'-flap endonuclease [Pycnora praestabilis]